MSTHCSCFSAVIPKFGSIHPRLKNRFVKLVHFKESIDYIFRLATERSWVRPYIGDGARTLYETLRFYNKTQLTPLYSRAIPLLQSSGTGKSRTLDELSKTVFVIPINLRGKGTEGLRWISDQIHKLTVYRNRVSGCG